LVQGCSDNVAHEHEDDTEASDTPKSSTNISADAVADIETGVDQIDSSSQRVVQAFAFEARLLCDLYNFRPITEQYLDDKSIAALSDLDELRILAASNHVSDVGASRIASHGESLQILDLHNSAITSTGLLQLAKMPNLRVCIINSPHLNDSDALAFHRETRGCVLRLLPDNVMYSPCTLYSKQSVGPSGRQSHVHVLLKPPMSDKQIDEISIYDEIESIYAGIPQWPLPKDFEESDYRLTNRSMEAMSKMPRLRRIQLGPATAIDDDGLKFLEGHKTLESVFIEGTSISNAGVDSFKSAMPKVRTTISKEYGE